MGFCAGVLATAVVFHLLTAIFLLLILIVGIGFGGWVFISAVRHVRRRK